MCVVDAWRRGKMYLFEAFVVLLAFVLLAWLLGELD